MKEVFETYSKAGLACLPTKTDKSPSINGTWKGGVKTGFTNSHGIGVVCGSSSSGVECIDFDNHFGDAKAIITAFSSIPEVKSILKNTVIESTVGGGYHIIFRCDTNQGNQKLASRPRKEGDIWKPDVLIETRGEGGYFVAAPTPGYVILKGTMKNIPKITREQREVLLNHARSFNQWVEKCNVAEERNGRPGDQYNMKPEAVSEMKTLLASSGWKQVSKYNWLRPGKEKGVSATLGRVADNVFYVFSTSAYPFDAGRGYTPFQVKSLLEHNGDFTSCARALGEKYAPPAINNIKKADVLGDKLESILQRSRIDLETPVEKPPVCMSIREKGTSQFHDQRLMTLGNFSAISGKGKSKKTFLTSMLLAASSSGEIQNKFIAEFPTNKRILLFDTEQSLYDAYSVSKRVSELIGSNPENFMSFSLREFSPKERCEIIEYALAKYSDELGFVVIDGIADLATGINDEEEASRVISLLLRWSKVYNCHITTVIHQNKGDDYATGHLGSSIIKKAEVVIKVSRTEENNRSLVECDVIRGAADFRPFEFYIDDTGLPVIDWNRQIREKF